MAPLEFTSALSRHSAAHSDVSLRGRAAYHWLAHFRAWLLLIVITLTGASLFPDALASADTPPRRTAFVVGNATYQNVPVLRNPMNDAEAVAAALRRSGFDVYTALDLNRIAFDAELRKFISSLEGADVSLFYYSGHGLQVGDDNRLIPIDATLKTSVDLEVETVSVRTILQYMQSNSRRQLIFLELLPQQPIPRSAILCWRQSRQRECIGRAYKSTSLTRQSDRVFHATRQRCGGWIGPIFTLHGRVP